MTVANGQPRESPLRVAVLAGGRSSEHEVSLSSGQAVREGLLAGGHEVLWVEISRDGEWRHEGELLSPTPGHGLLGADVAFPVLHGPFGEDGTVQGMLETLAVPYVGSGVAASAVSLDKILFKELMSVTGIPQVDFVGLSAWRRWPARRRGARAARAAGVREARPPRVLGRDREGHRPRGARRGDRAGLLPRRARDRGGGGAGPRGRVRGARQAPGRRRGRGDGDGGPALASPLGEIVFGGEWYDYEAKYAPGGMQLIVPARIPPAAERRARELALEVFAAAGCEGLARVDFFVDGEQVLVNELNTMPGFTPTSVYAKLVEAAGIPYPQLVERLCRLACERHRRLAALRR